MNIAQKRSQLQQGKTIYDMNIRVAYYARVSTDKKDQANSLHNQKTFYEDYIKQQENWVYSGQYIDFGISGSHTKRPSFKKMIQDGLEGAFDLIITKEISRFSRSTIDSIQYTKLLLENGVCVFFHGDNLNTLYEDCELRLTIMSSIAQDELRRLSQRVRFGLDQAKKEGKILGNGNVYGYKKINGRLYINNDPCPHSGKSQADFVKDLFELYATGNYGVRTIEKILTEKGYKNQKGGPISPHSLVRIIKNEVYTGKKEDENGVSIPQLIPQSLWLQANYVAEARSLLNGRKSQRINKTQTLEKILFHMIENKNLYTKNIDELIAIYEKATSKTKK